MHTDIYDRRRDRIAAEVESGALPLHPSGPYTAAEHRRIAASHAAALVRCAQPSTDRDGAACASTVVYVLHAGRASAGVLAPFLRPSRRGAAAAEDGSAALVVLAPFLALATAAAILAAVAHPLGALGLLLHAIGV